MSYRYRILLALCFAFSANHGARGATLTITHPLDSDIFRAGDITEITGTVGGSGFQYYLVDWGFGQSPTTWYTTGVVLTGGGTSPVSDGLVATWDTSSITNATFTTLRVTVVSGGPDLVELLQVYLDPTLQEGWPVKLNGLAPGRLIFPVRRWRSVIRLFIQVPRVC